MTSIIQLQAARTTAKGRPAPATYHLGFTYPPLLSGRRPDVQVTREPASARTYTDAEGLQAALALLRSLGYTDPQVVELALVEDLDKGARILYPIQGSTGRTTHEPHTISGIVEHPETRVLYFEEGGFGVADRGTRLPLAEVAQEPVVYRPRPDCYPQHCQPFAPCPRHELAADIDAGRVCGSHERPVPCLECQ